MKNCINPIYVLTCPTKKNMSSNTGKNISCQTSQLPHIPSLISENVSNMLYSFPSTTRNLLLLFSVP